VIASTVSPRGDERLAVMPIDSGEPQQIVVGLTTRRRREPRCAGPRDRRASSVPPYAPCMSSTGRSESRRLMGP